jgi:hypothetical protein
VLNIISIKKCGSAMDEDLNPKMKVRVQVLLLAPMIPRPFGLG